MKIKNSSTVTEFILLGFSSDPGTQIVLFLVFLASFMVLLAVNGLLILAVSFDHHLHKPMYFFLMNLSLIHIASSSAFVPKMLVMLLHGERRISFAGCAAQVYVDLLGGSECINLLFMAYDRYVAICKPLRYHMIMSISACTRMITCTWTVSSLIASVDTYFLCSLLFCGPNVINHFFCSFPALILLSCNSTTFVGILAFIGSATILLVPLPLIILSYYKIIASIKRILSGRYKAFSSCLSHLIIVTMFYLLVVVIYSKPSDSRNSNREKIVSLFYVIITPILNPIIYCLKNEDVLTAMKRVGRLKWSVLMTSYIMGNHNVRRRPFMRMMTKLKNNNGTT